MIKYKNVSNVSQIFYGIVFEPDSIKEVPGYINAKNFIRVTDEVSDSIESKLVTEPVKSDAARSTTNPSNKSNDSSVKSTKTIKE